MWKLNQTEENKGKYVSDLWALIVSPMWLKDLEPVNPANQMTLGVFNADGPLYSVWEERAPEG